MFLIRHVLERKGKKITAVLPDATVHEAIALMSEKNAGAVLVMENEQVRGIFSERDFIKKVFLKGVTNKDLKVKEVMTKDVVLVNADQSTEDAMKLMTHEKIRHLPVIEGDKIVGVVSIGDLVKFLLAEKDQAIMHYEKYIYEGY